LTVILEKGGRTAHIFFIMRNKAITIVLATAMLSGPAMSADAVASPVAGFSASPAAAPTDEMQIAGELPAEPVVRLKNSAVKATQHNLRRQGYAPGRADGQLNARTRDAIRSFQQDCGLPVNSSAVAATADRLNRPGSCPSAGSK
jgi:peptidoglycan hydrolase-like protein with peptidoglycan-binding domain